MQLKRINISSDVISSEFGLAGSIAILDYRTIDRRVVEQGLSEHDKDWPGALALQVFKALPAVIINTGVR